MGTIPYKFIRQTHLASHSQPSNAFQPATTEQHFKAQALGNYMTEVYNQN